jgi:hypothetical protein
MTAIAFILEPTRVSIAMDTLIVDHQKKMPLNFQRKFLSIPEINIAICGTGVIDLINEWFKLVSASSAKGIDDLNSITPSALRYTSSRHQGSYVASSTLYHFGYSKINRQYVGYAYKSENEFESERLADSTLIYKPAVDIKIPDDVQVPQFLVDILLKQESEDRQQITANQVGIGGEIDYLEMQDLKVSIDTVHRFNSYEADCAYFSSKN